VILPARFQSISDREYSHRQVRTNPDQKVTAESHHLIFIFAKEIPSGNIFTARDGENGDLL
jgi:hypothetical protein